MRFASSSSWARESSSNVAHLAEIERHEVARERAILPEIGGADARRRLQVRPTLDGRNIASPDALRCVIGTGLGGDVLALDVGANEIFSKPLLG